MASLSDRPFKKIANKTPLPVWAIIPLHHYTIYGVKPTKACLYPLGHILNGNRSFAESVINRDPKYFQQLAKGQSPSVLWIGCADSRVPETTICACQPGDIFVHRNIANCVHADDTNVAAVVEYAVAHVKVSTVVLCGHTKCGGAVASLGDADLGETLNTWLHPVRELRRKNWDELKALSSDDERAVKVAELNVLRGLDVLKEHQAIKNAIRDRGLTVHGAIFDLATGTLRVLDERAQGPGGNNGLWQPPN